jgi:hypothetical protein
MASDLFVHDFNSLMNKKMMNNTKRDNMRENHRKEETEEVLVFHLSAGGFDRKCQEKIYDDER